MDSGGDVSRDHENRASHGPVRDQSRAVQIGSHHGLESEHGLAEYFRVEGPGVCVGRSGETATARRRRSIGPAARTLQSGLRAKPGAARRDGERGWNVVSTTVVPSSSTSSDQRFFLSRLSCRSSSHAIASTPRAGPVAGQPHLVLGTVRLSRESPARQAGRPSGATRHLRSGSTIDRDRFSLNQARGRLSRRT
jgi:hypothetical protein